MKPNTIYLTNLFWILLKIKLGFKMTWDFGHTGINCWKHFMKKGEFVKPFSTLSFDKLPRVRLTLSERFKSRVTFASHKVLIKSKVRGLSQKIKSFSFSHLKRTLQWLIFFSITIKSAHARKKNLPVSQLWTLKIRDWNKYLHSSK